MKRKITLFLSIVLAVLFIGLTSCSPIDTTSETSEPENKYANIKIPEIKSDDEIMPTYFDISLYDEENYADIYLGKDYDLRFTYCGNELNLPTSFDDMKKLGWKIAEGQNCNEKSQILAGKKMTVNFINDYNNILSAVFYNSSNSSELLEDCDLVRFSVNENRSINPESAYGQFWLNGITNDAAITDVIAYLGNPSHFHSEGSGRYYLDFFFNEKDKRNKITVHVDTENDCVIGIEYSKYD